MLSLTDRALPVLRDLTTRRGAPDAGVRIAARPSGHGLHLRVVDAPETGDHVVVHDTVRVYLDDAAASRLRGRVLDARSDERGAAFFL